jgi:hypothetical protein
MKSWALFCRAFAVGSGPAQHRIDGQASLGDGIAEFGKRQGRIAAALDQGFQTSGRIGDAERTDRARRPLQGMRQRAGVRGQGRQSGDQTGRLGRKHRQHFALEAGIAKRHAVKMFDIDRSVIGSEGRRWHPGNPFQMKRHGDYPKLAPLDRSDSEVLASQSREWLTERFASLPQVRRFFGEELPQLSKTHANFEDF